MNTFKLRNAVLVAAIVGTLAACGGGGGGGAAVTPFTGGVFDGKVTGATVVCDSTPDGTFTAGEGQATSDGNGNFTITGGCSSSIVAYGGTNADTGEAFLGKLKAPASTTNSTFVTPLTTLMKDGGLTAAEIATALALPVGTNPATVDPSSNVAVHAATVAVQQIIQQTAATIMASALVTTAPSVTSATTQDLYALVANRVATHIKATPTTATITPLITGSSGVLGAATVSPALVNLIVSTSIADASVSTDTDLATIITAPLVANNINAASVATLVTGAIVSQAETLASTSSQSGLTTGVNTLQSSTTIATVVTTFLPVLTTAANTASTTVGTQLALAATALATMSTATTVAPSDVTALNTAADTAATAAGTANPVDLSTTTFAPTNYLAIASDTVSFNGTSYTLANFKSPGVTVSSPVQGSLDTIALTFSPVGTTPFTSTTGTAASTQASLGLEVKDVSTTNQRVLQMVIDKVDLALNTQGQITATIPATAKLYVYGKNAAGTSVNVTLTNVSANTITTASNTVSFNAGTVLDAAIASLGTSNSVFSNIRNAKGIFNVKFALTNTDLYTGTSPVPADAASVQVTNTTPAIIATGKGAAGIVTVQ